MSAPRGTIALAFTDVQGSTALWDRIPAVMRASLEIHDQVMRAVIGEAGGYEVKTEGDAFMVAFTAAGAAVQWCIDAQRQLLDAPWPEALLEQPEAGVVEVDGAVIHRGLRVRMGVHVGEPHCDPNPLTGRMDYFGSMVNRAARVSGVGHGGQILISSTVAEITGESESTRSTDLGEHLLKGLSKPERIWQIDPEGLGARSFPAIRTEMVSKSNLTRPTPELIGRGKELDELARRIRELRAVTLYGSPGVGKTRLAREFAWDNIGEFSKDGSGVWLCDLSQAESTDDVCQSVAAVVAPTLELRTGDAREQLGRYLSRIGKTLLVLDNADAAMEEVNEVITAWTDFCPHLHVVITSRQRVCISVEQCLEIRPLAIEPALELFVMEANKVGAEVDGEDASTLVEKLDRLPLAIRLAASRMRFMNPEQIGEQLEKGVAKFSGLEKVLETSWNLLTPSEQCVLARCSLFHGGFTLDAATEILTTGENVVEELQSLLDLSLIATGGMRASGVRFQLLRSVRDFASGKLEQQDDRAEGMEAWGNFYVALGTELMAQVATRNGIEALGKLRAEQSDLLAVAESAEVAPALRIQAGLAVECQLSAHGPVQRRRTLIENLLGIEDLDPVQRLRCLVAQNQLMRDTGDLALAQTAIARSDALVAESGSSIDNTLMSHLESAAGTTARTLGDIESGKRRITKAIDLACEADDPHAECLALDALAALEQDRGDYRIAGESMERAIEIALKIGDLRTAARLRHNLGTILQDKGDPLGADRCYRTSMEMAGEIGDTRLQCIARANLGNRCNDRGALEEGRELLYPALESIREAGDLRFEGHIHMYLGINHLLSGDLSGARDHLDQAAELERRSGTRRFEGLCFGYLGILSHLARQPRTADEQLQSAVSILSEMGDNDMTAYFLTMLSVIGREAGGGECERAERARELAAASLSGWLPPCVDFLLANTADGSAATPDPDIAANQHISISRLVVGG